MTEDLRGAAACSASFIMPSGKAYREPNHAGRASPPQAQCGQRTARRLGKLAPHVQHTPDAVKLEDLPLPARSCSPSILGDQVNPGLRFSISTSAVGGVRLGFYDELAPRIVPFLQTDAREGFGCGQLSGL
jgi:hypothetical protein